MKVKELIEELKKHDQEIDILILSESDVATYLYYKFEAHKIHERFLGPRDSICDGPDFYRNYLVIE